MENNQKPVENLEKQQGRNSKKTCGKLCGKLTNK